MKSIERMHLAQSKTAFREVRLLESSILQCKNYDVENGYRGFTAACPFLGALSRLWERLECVV